MGIERVKTIDDIVPVRHALISVSDKRALEQFTQGLLKISPEISIYSTGGTYKKIKEVAPYNVEQVSEYTGMPETRGGLVKTLHHKLFLGYLTETYNEDHQADMQREGAKPIDLVVCNLYPFQDVVSKGADIEDARGNIDIGVHQL